MAQDFIPTTQAKGIYQRVVDRIVNDPELRQQYYETHQKIKRERDEEHRHQPTEAELADRRQALWDRLGYSPADFNPRFRMTAAEAFVKETMEMDPANAPSRGEMRRLIEVERQRLNAARRRLRELGIR